jgi:hypothetical protein
MKRAGCFMMMAVFLVMAMSAPLLATEPLPLSISKITFDDEERGPSGEAIILDVVLFRPLGLASMAVGMAGAFIAAPWACATCSQDDVQRALICEPYEYTFVRKLGYLENDRY